GPRSPSAVPERLQRRASFRAFGYFGGLFPLQVDPQPLRPRLDLGDGDVRMRQVEHHVELVAVRPRMDAGADLQHLRGADDDARLGERLADAGEAEQLARRVAVDPAL